MAAISYGTMNCRTTRQQCLLASLPLLVEHDKNIIPAFMKSLHLPRGNDFSNLGFYNRSEITLWSELKSNFSECFGLC